MSNLPEHSALGTPPNDHQPDPDKKDVQMVMKLFKKYKKHRSRYDRNFMHYYKMFRGDQWSGIKMPRHRQKEIVNMIWTAIQSSLPLQTDARPRIVYIPEEPNDTEFAQVLNMVLEADWERNNWLVPVTEMILDGYIYGLGYMELGYDESADFGLGSATLQSEDPFYLYPDPKATDINCKDSQGFIKAEPVDTQWLKKQYPDWEDDIKADIVDSIDSSKTALNDFKIRVSNTDRDMPDVTEIEGREKSIEKTLLITAYLKPDETEEVEVEDVDEAGEATTKFITKKKYPFGRVITVANGIKLKEEPLPFNHGKFPFVRYLNYILPREFFGVSEVEQLESPQRVFNKLLNASLEILNLMGNPIWIVDTSSGVNPHKLVNKTGLVVEKEPGSEVRREMGTQLNPTALQLIDRMEQWFNNVAGTQDVTRGQTPGSVTAASAIEQLQEAARTRIRQKQRNLDDTIRQLGKMYAEMVLEKYNKNRVFRVTNDEGSTKYFKFRTEKRIVGDKEQLVGILRQYQQSEDGQILPRNEAKEYLISGSFDVRVNTGSALPFTVADKESKALNLFDRGIIDEEEVLNIMDYPNREQILQRLKERQAAAAQQEQQQGA